MVPTPSSSTVSSLADAARLGRWWVLSAAVHLGGGSAVYLSLPDREPPPPEVEELTEVRLLPPPSDLPTLEEPKEDRRQEAATRQRTENPAAPERLKPRKDARGLGGRVGPQQVRPSKAAAGAAPVQSRVARRRRPARLPPVTRVPPPDKKRPKPQRAPEIDHGKARDAAQRTMDSFVGRLEPEDVVPEEQAFARIMERTAEAPAVGDMPRVGRRGELRRPKVSQRPPGDEGLGASGAPDIRQRDITLRMDADLMRRHPYWREVYRRVQPLWRFPRWAEERKLQGEVHIAFRFHAETGAVSDFEIVRRSRIDGFDANVIEAVKAAAPFGRVPVDAPTATQIVWPFKFRNPIF